MDLFTRKPCKRCLVQACCTENCDDLDKWHNKFKFVNDTIDIILLLFGIGSLFLLAFINALKIISDDRANMFANKVENTLENRIRRNY